MCHDFPDQRHGRKQGAWERFRDGRYVAIGWLYKTDVTGKSVEQIKKLIRQARYEDSDKRDGHRSFPLFLGLDVGDYVAVKNVSDGLFGLGRIASGVQVRGEKTRHRSQGFFLDPHYRKVNWLITEYMSRKALIRKGERAWQPYHTIGQVYPELPPYIAQSSRKRAVPQTRQGRVPLRPRDVLTEDVNDIQESNRSSTTRKAPVKARKGQGVFRTQVLQRWGNACAVTGSVILDAIRASHIKPWRQSTDAERLDPANGLPLIASLDVSFDSAPIR